MMSSEGDVLVVRQGEKMAAVSDRPIARRAVLGGVLGAIAAVAAPSFPALALSELAFSELAFSEGPPLFASARHQFTILQPTRMVPPVPITRLDGSTTTFDSFRGKVVLVNFWATWCPACRIELPLLDQLQQTAGGKDLQVIAISLDRGGGPTVAPFVRDLKLRHLGIYLDPEGRIARAGDDDNAAVPFGRYGMPISYVIDPAGRIAGYLAGEADWMSDAARNLLGYYAARDRG
jgi:thiol-disulfide isomerase/thioredoxin